jgi:hypothetical protein
LIGIDIVITEKLDGSNSSITNKGVYARSHSDFSKNPWDKQMWNIWERIKNDLSDGVYLFGENMEGIHSIEYTNLDSYFYIFGVRDNNIFISWDEVEEYSYLLDIPTVPVLFRGVINSEKELIFLNGKTGEFNVYQFVGDNLISIGKDWSGTPFIRLWIWKKGDRFSSHEPPILEENKKLQETISVQTQQIDEIKTQLLLCKTSIKPTRALCLTNDILSPRSFDKVKKIFSDNGIVMYLENINKQPSEFPPMNAGSIYLFWPAQFILSEKKIYKIGKTRQTGNKRLSGYLKGSIRLCEFICEDPDKAEKELLLIFKDKFIPYTGIGGGNEYFEGNWKEMYTEILKYLNMR